jgi:hypothetical protein
VIRQLNVRYNLHHPEICLGKGNIQAELESVLEATDGKIVGRAFDFAAFLFTRYHRERFFLSENGCSGIGPCNLKENNRIVIFAVATMPMIIRAREEQFCFLGSALVYGIMEGEAWPMEDSEALESFTLV